MKKNLPNYYDILRVPPDASQEVIKASYRKLMVTLKMHPDLGGDHNIAAQINEAYEVLRDKAKRVQHDRMDVLQQLRRAAQSAARAKEYRPGNNAGARPRAASASKPNSTPNPTRSATASCPLCGAALPQSIGPETHCERCRSPLSAPPTPGGFGRELFGRRASPRSAKAHLGTIYPAGHSQGITVKMRDLSLNGLSFYSELALGVEQTFKFRDSTLEAVASVVSCRKEGRFYSVHARFLTVDFHQKTGVFVSTMR